MHKALCEAFVGEMLGKARASAEERKGCAAGEVQALEPCLSTYILALTWFQNCKGFLGENYGCLILRDFHTRLRV